ncbi:MAG: hypothetical protein JO266_19230 [Acidobacteria bacterium]|nr:hypothetical protein [Alphaproteobacteria bacterium]MBV8894071.1 hypothetical protein [Acidobacteriota bacterium]
MSPFEQPISQLPLVASLIDGGVEEAAAQRQILTEARTRPHLLDDATLDRVDQVYREEQEWLAVCEEQLRRWRQDHPSSAEEREIDRLAEEIERLKPIVAEILALSAEIRTGTIDRIMEMSDAELGLKALLGQLPRPF